MAVSCWSFRELQSPCKRLRPIFRCVRKAIRAQWFGGEDQLSSGVCVRNRIILLADRRAYNSISKELSAESENEWFKGEHKKCSARIDIFAGLLLLLYTCFRIAVLRLTEIHQYYFRLQLLFSLLMLVNFRRIAYCSLSGPVGKFNKCARIAVLALHH